MSKALKKQQERLESRRKRWRELPSYGGDSFRKYGFDGYHMPGSMNPHKGTEKRGRR